jgi:hypothetical protein
MNYVNYTNPLSFNVFNFDSESVCDNIRFRQLHELDVENNASMFSLANEDKLVENNTSMFSLANEDKLVENTSDSDDDDYYYYLLANKEKIKKLQKQDEIWLEKPKQKKEIILIKEFSFRQMQTFPILLVYGKNKKDQTQVVKNLINERSVVYFENKVDNTTLRNILGSNDKSKYSIVFDECFGDYDSYDSKTKCAVYELFITQNETKISIIITSSSITSYPQFIKQLFDYVLLLPENDKSIQKVLRNKYGKNHENFSQIFDQIKKSASAMVLQQKHNHEVFYLMAENIDNENTFDIVDVQNNNIDPFLTATSNCFTV